jgi:hypothetical protein
VDLKQALESAIGILARRTAPVQTTEDDCLPREYRDMAECDAVLRGHCAMDVKKAAAVRPFCGGLLDGPNCVNCSKN